MDKQLKLKLTKRFERDDDDESRVRPAYVNNIDLARVGGEVFMDLCIMPMDDFARAKENEDKEGEHSVEVIVLDRYVFGIETFLRLHAAVETVYRELAKLGALPTNATIRTTNTPE
ncbi:MAG: hypothetical protein WBY44_24160 [Bryobacteraceae bacterium]|jgi:hypothetical protein